MAQMKMTESDLQRAVLDLAKLHGLLVHHCRPAVMRSGKWATPIEGDPGFVDLVIVGPGGVLFWELKSATGTVSADQARWLSALRDAGGSHSAWVVRPRDLRAGHVEAALKQLAKPGAALDQAERETR